MYKAITKVIEKWPKDESRIPRDFGTALSLWAKKYNDVDGNAKLARQARDDLDAVQNLLNDTAKKMYPRDDNRAATNDTKSAYANILSAESQNDLKNGKKGGFKSMFKR